MRIEINPKIEEALDRVKAEHHIYGKGHTDTVSYLVEFYERHAAVDVVLKRELGRIPEAIETGCLHAMRTVVLNLLTEKDVTPK